MQPEQGHGVVLLEHLDRSVVDVGAVLGAQPDRFQPAGEQVVVQPVGIARAVLVVLELDQRRLRTRLQGRGTTQELGSASLRW